MSSKYAFRHDVFAVVISSLTGLWEGCRLFQIYTYPVPDGTSPLHGSPNRPESSFSLEQQRVLDFRSQNVFFRNCLKPGR
ncbi:MAG: hypothetical protein KAR36_08325, partial [Candidatus Latescibacteria bacterium]|nr:hypothetical protein [Candidatus Latescibacterota bacterium]